MTAAIHAPAGIALTPRPPSGPPQRGGFFRALGVHRQSAIAADVDPSSPSAGSHLRHPAGLSSPESPEAAAAAASRKLKSQEARASSQFLEKLNLRFLDKLWVAIKKNAMQQAEKDYRTIRLDDFLRLSREQMSDAVSETERLQHEKFLEMIFRRVDRRQRGSVRTTDIATALVVICSEDPLLKLHCLFRIFDADDDGCLTHDQIFDMYLSIKQNDITKSRQALVADIVFDDELSLQESKRLYELTVEHLGGITAHDFVIFEEFARVFGGRAFLLQDLLPGAFSLEWMLQDYHVPSFRGAFAGDIKRDFVNALRHGEEHLNLTRELGRGTRIMQSCQNLSSHKPPPNAGQAERERREGEGAGGTASTPRNARPSLAKLKRAKSKPVGRAAATPRSAPASGAAGATVSPGTPGAGAPGGGAGSAGGHRNNAEEPEQDGEGSDSSDDDEDLAPTTTYTGPANANNNNQGRQPPAATAAAAAGGRHSPGQGPASARGAAGGGTAKAGTYSIQEALELPAIPSLTINHKNSKRFRDMTLDAKTQQAYLRDKTDVNRTQKYQCLVCAVNHEFRLSKSAARAEHQHAHG